MNHALYQKVSSKGIKILSTGSSAIAFSGVMEHQLLPFVCFGVVFVHSEWKFSFQRKVYSRTRLNPCPGIRCTMYLRRRKNRTIKAYREMHGVVQTGLQDKRQWPPRLFARPKLCCMKGPFRSALQVFSTGRSNVSLSLLQFPYCMRVCYYGWGH